ncbi:MAG: hypothetical protein HXS46_16855 [Theionarchaea archaeon]|nr:hypothetical protein [Theionarchaea archaeon]
MNAILQFLQAEIPSVNRAIKSTKSTQERNRLRKIRERMKELIGEEENELKGDRL